MAQHRTRKQKEKTNYQFLVSWSPTRKVYDPEGNLQARVKGESASTKNAAMHERSNAKNANLWTKDGVTPKVKKDIVKSLTLVSFILILEVVVYLSLHR